jgi:drug/metabolite transporter (DMT)-like permease
VLVSVPTMPTWLLFTIPAVIWSTTFYAITLQLPHAHPAVSLTYRFGLAACCMFALAWRRGELKRMSVRLHILTALLGLLQYTLSYSMTYNAERFAPSGLASLAFTLLVFLNPLGGALFFRRKVLPGVVVGGLLGFLGVVLMFGSALKIDGSVVHGLWLLMVATVAASAGNMFSLSLGASGTPSSCFTAWGMLYGTVGFAVYATAAGAAWILPVSLSYWGALLHLAVLGTAVAFGCYTVLLTRIGPVAAYMSVVTPFGALLVSVVFEGMVVSMPLLVGFALAMLGAFFALHRSQTAAAN